MLAVEILDLVKVEQHAPCAKDVSGFADHVLDVGKRRRGGVELAEGHAGFFCDDGGGGGLSRAGRAKEDHVCDPSPCQHTAYHTALSKEVLLPHDPVKVLGSQQIGKLRVFHSDVHPFSICSSL